MHLEILHLSATGSAQLLCAQPSANRFACCPGLGLRGSRRPSAGICRLSHWDTKESFPGCSKRFDAKASASRQLGDLVTDRYWRNGVLASQRKVQVKLKSLGTECCDPRGRSVCPSRARRVRVTRASLREWASGAWPLCDCSPARVYCVCVGVTGLRV